MGIGGIAGVQKQLKDWWKGEGKFETKTPNTYDLPLSEEFKERNITGGDLIQLSENALNNNIGLGLNNEKTTVETLNELYKDQPI